jgi:NAD(P)H dehydrogenase (quinone)
MGVHIAGLERVDRTVVDFPKVGGRRARARREPVARHRAAGAGRSGRARPRPRPHLRPHEVTVDLAEDGTEVVLPADYVLLATGSTARVLPFFEPDGERVLVGQQVYGLPRCPST